jgi:hypothetical protein
MARHAGPAAASNWRNRPFRLWQGYPPGLPETAHMDALDQANHDGESHRM